ncbi:MAG TPA: tetratricopeptide repeat protein, partial [Thermoanaerobaculia bacterium]
YELGLTYSTKGDNVACKSTTEPWASKKGKYQSAFLAILGNCLDGMGDTDGAIKTYRRGLKIAPEDTQLLYNLAVSLMSKNETAEAMKVLKKELGLQPNHASGHFALGTLFHQENFRAAALLEYLRFLSVQPSGDRAKVVAERALELMGAGVKNEGGGKITVTIDPDSRKEEGDFSAFETTMGLTAASETLVENEKLREFDKKRGTVVTMLKILTELDLKGRSYTHTTNIPFFKELAKAELLETFGAIALVSLGLDGTKEWVDAHGEDIKKYAAFMQQQVKP